MTTMAVLVFVDLIAVWWLSSDFGGVPPISGGIFSKDPFVYILKLNMQPTDLEKTFATTQ